jgi:hypothetical protein
LLGEVTIPGFPFELVASFTKWPKSCKDKRLSDSLWDHHRT